MSQSTQKPVPFFNYPHVFQSEEEELTAAFQDVGRRGAFILQKDVKELEDSIAKYTGAKHALGVANATDALIIALRAMGIGAGDEVIFCSHTFVATASAIHWVGATPVPVEAGPDHLMDPAAIEKAITVRTKAIMPTQLNGRTCDMDAIEGIARKHGLLIVEDAAQGLGSKFKGKFAGTFGAASCISFYPAKILGCLGDGGLILTSDTALYEEMSKLRSHGVDHQGQVVTWGLNSRLDNLQAAILNLRFKKYDSIIARRREIATLYQEYLGGLKEVTLPPKPEEGTAHFDVYQNYEIEADNRDELKAYLASKGIGTLIQWNGKAVHQWPGLGFKISLPYTEKLFTRMLMIPMNLSLSNEDVKTVADSIRSFYKKH